MFLSWPEIRNRAVEFQRRWKGETSERVAFLFALNQNFTSLFAKRCADEAKAFSNPMKTANG